MAISCCEAPSADYFSTQNRPKNSISTSPFSWENISYNDPALATDSGGSTLPSPIFPESLAYPQTAYTLPKQDPIQKQQPQQESVLAPVIKSEPPIYNFGTFDDWMAWDDPSDTTLSPTSEKFFPSFDPKAMISTPSASTLPPKTDTYTNIQTERAEDDSVAFGQVPMSEEPLFQTSSTGSLISPPLTESEAREGLYSTPLSWTRPSIGVKDRGQYGRNDRLSPEEEEVLRNIAMPPTSTSSNQAQYPTSPSTTSSLPSSPSSGTRKRKSGSRPASKYTNSKTQHHFTEAEDFDIGRDDEEVELDEDMSEPTTHSTHPPIRKTAHNMIEKRYRTNLNDRIAALRDSVPALRVMSKKSSRGKGKDFMEDLQGLTPAHKLNKATILSKASEYISHLEKLNRSLSKENASLKARVDAFEILLLSRQSQIALSLSQPLPLPPIQAPSQQAPLQVQAQRNFNGGRGSFDGGARSQRKSVGRGYKQQQQLRQQQQQQQQQHLPSRQQYLMDGMMGPI